MNKWKEEELFQRERLALSNLNHKFIPKFIDKFDIKKGKRLNYYTVIEYIDGENLKNFIKNKKFEENKVIYFLEVLAGILDYIHSFTPPIIHRDIKPSNIIIKDDGFYLIDFGSVTNIVKEEGGSTIAGTFGYMAPEQFLGKANAATDYYALGIIAIEMLINRSPEDFLDNHSVKWEKLRISKEMKEIISKLLTYDYKNRVSSKEDLLLLLSPPAKERKFDIINILTEYNKNKLDLERAKEIEWYNLVYALVATGLSVPIFRYHIGFFIFYAILAIIFAFVIEDLKLTFYASKKIDQLIDDGIEREMKLAVSILFNKNNLSEEKQKKFNKDMEERISQALDLNKSLEYNKAFKDRDFIDKHINKLEEYGEIYIHILKEKLKDKNNNNFDIPNKEIENKIKSLKELKEGFYNN